VQQALLNLLAQLGLVRVDPATGRPVMMIPSGGMPGAAPTPLGATGQEPAPAAAPQSALWTPDQGVPAAAEGKSKLWLPGME
jgi:hypothetical protein